MRDGLAAGHFAPGAFDIDMDPLMVTCRLGEQVDGALVHSDPFTGAELAADPVGQGSGCLDIDHLRRLERGAAGVNPIHG